MLQTISPGPSEILPVLLYGREAWTLALKKEHSLWFKNRVLRRIFVPTRDEVTGYNEELDDVHSSQNIILVIKTIRMR